jgi:hypothetical protein
MLLLANVIYTCSLPDIFMTIGWGLFGVPTGSFANPDERNLHLDRPTQDLPAHRERFMTSEYFGARCGTASVRRRIRARALAARAKKLPPEGGSLSRTGQRP